MTWALKTIIYLEKKVIPILETSGSAEDAKSLEEITSGIARAKKRIIGLPADKKIPFPGTAGFDNVVNLTIEKLKNRKYNVQDEFDLPDDFFNDCELFQLPTTEFRTPIDNREGSILPPMTIPDPDQKNSVDFEEDKYNETCIEFISACSAYILKLENDLKEFKPSTSSLENNEYSEPNAKYVLKHLAWSKREIMLQAQAALQDDSKTSEEKIATALGILQAPDNKATLMKRRDSLFMAIIKIVATLGGILLYRWSQNDEVTHGIKNVNLFAKKYDELKQNVPDQTSTNSKKPDKNGLY